MTDKSKQNTSREMTPEWLRNNKYQSNLKDLNLQKNAKLFYKK